MSVGKMTEKGKGQESLPVAWSVDIRKEGCDFAAGSPLQGPIGH